MWPFTKKRTRQRRVEVRKNLSGKPSMWKRFRTAGGVPGTALVLMFYLGVLVMDVLPLDPLPYRRGQYVPEDIRARTSFRVLSADRRSQKERDIRSETPATFRLNRSRLDAIVSGLQELPDALAAMPVPDDEEPPVEPALREGPLARFGVANAQELQALRDRFAQPGRQELYLADVQRLRDRLLRTAVVRPEELRSQNQRRALEAKLVWDEERVQVPITAMVSVLDAARLRNVVDDLLTQPALFDPLTRERVRHFLAEEVRQGPLYTLDARTTQEEVDAAVAAMQQDPPDELYDQYARGDVLVRATPRDAEEGSAWRIQGLTDEERRLLAREHEEHHMALRAQNPLARPLRILGRGLVVLLATMLLSLYIARYQPHLTRNFWRGLAVMVTLLLALGISKTMTHALELNPHAVVLAVLATAYAMNIAYGRRFALTIVALISAFIVLQMRAGIPMLVTLLAGASLGVFLLDEIRTRTKLLRVSTAAAGMVAVGVWAYGLATWTPWRFTVIDSLWGAGSAMLAGFLVWGILPGIEKLFNTATSMTLLEWCDPSKPLLRHLATTAPGTYNHSLQLGTMCEAAAEKIGAHGLLARVGSYYHDIGKTNKAEYFIENQSGSTSKHEKLSPAMSLLIIIGHVKDGLEMAREYNVPDPLHEFIASHHGTTLVQYFYRAATEQRKESADRAPDEVEFRYPGPKPQSKEAAILMLADVCESSVRAMNDPTPGRIENQVHTMVTRRLMDGQLDECDLTLREVHAVEESFIKSLCSIYHSRIAYPTPAGEKPSAGETPSRRAGAEGPKAEPRNQPAETPAPEKTPTAK